MYHCEELSTIDHSSDIVESRCPLCRSADGLVKVLTSFSTSGPAHQKKRVGHITEEFIQDSRAELNRTKQEWKVED